MLRSVIPLAFLLLLAQPILAYDTYPSTVCKGSTVTYTTTPNQSNYKWTITGGVENVDYKVTAGSLTSQSVTIQWLTLGTRTLNASYVNTDIREAFRVTTISQLSGTYSINANGTGDFSSLKAAAAVYNSCGLQGNTTLRIVSDLTEDGRVDFFGTAPGSDTYTLTITTDNTRRTVRANTSDGPVIRLTAANNITIDGITPINKNNVALNDNKLVVFNTNTEASVYRSTLEILADGSNKGKNIIIKNVELKNDPSNITTLGVANLKVTTDKITVTGCYMHDANESVLMQGLEYITFTNNIVRNVKNTGVSIEASAVVPNTYVLSQNDIGNISGTAESKPGELLLQGIYLRSAGGGNVTIEDNTIHDINNLLTTSSAVHYGAYGILLSTDATLNINRNTIENISNATTHSDNNASGIYGTFAANAVANLNANIINRITDVKHPAGIDFYSAAPSAIALLSNNIISNIAASAGISGNFASGIWMKMKAGISGSKISAISADGTAAGIYCDQSLGQVVMFNNMLFDVKGDFANGFSLQGNASYLVYQNSVCLNSRGAGPTETSCLRVGNAVAQTSADIQNNIFSNESAQATSDFAVYVALNSTYSSKNNRYYSPKGTVGYFGGMGTDIHSYVVNPLFRSSTDLHLSSYPISLRVPVIAGYTTDIDGTTRTGASVCEGNNMAGVDVSTTASASRLSGNYIIAVPSAAIPNPAFTSLMHAADIYNACGVSGPTTFTVSSDLVETGAVQFFGTAPGSDIHSLTITSDGSVQRTVSASVADDGVINLKDAQNITIDGVVPAKTGINLLAVKNTYGEHNGMATIKVKGGSGIIIKNIEIYNSSRNTTGITNLSFIATGNGQSITVEGCYLHDANQNAYFFSYPEGGFQLTFKDNKITTSTGTGVYMDLFNPVSCTITDNIISDFVTSLPIGGIVPMRGIYVLSYGASIYTITGNTIKNLNNTGIGGAFGMLLQTDGTLNIKNNTIDNIIYNNSYVGYYAAGIDCQLRHYFQGVANIDKNIISNISAPYNVCGVTITPYAAHYPNNTTNATDAETATITNNVVLSISSDIAGYVATGVQLNTVGTMSANKIYNVTNSSGSASGISAMLGYTSDNATLVFTSSKTPLFVNNMVSGITGSYFKAGIYLLGNSSYTVYHNSVALTGQRSSYGACLVLGDLFNTYTTKADLQNNLFSNTATGTGYAYVLSVTGANPTFTAVKNNRYYSNSSDYVVYYNNFYSVSDWLSVYGTDKFLSAVPTFSGTDLHLSGASLTDGNLTVPLLSNVSVDIDGDARSSCSNAAGADNNKIGNMEMSTVNPVCEGSPTITVTVTNAGSSCTYAIDGTITGPTTNNGNDYTFTPAQPLTPGQHSLSIIRTGDACAVSGTLTVTPLPDVTISSTSAVCYNSNATITFTRSTGMPVDRTYTIDYTVGESEKTAAIGIGATSVDVALTAITGPVVVTQVADGVCSQTYTSENQPTLKPVTIALPVIAKDPADSIVCGTGNQVMLTATAYNEIAGYVWYKDNVLFENCGNATGCGSNVLSVNASGAYTVQAFIEGCNSPVSSPVIVTINSVPVAPNIQSSNNGVICGNGTVELTLTANGTYINPTYTWYKNGVFVATGATFTTSDEGTYTVTVAVAGCTSEHSAEAIVVHNELPQINGSVAGQIIAAPICSGSDFSYEAVSSVQGTEFLWSRAGITGINGGAAASGLGGIINETLVNTTNAPVDAMYTITMNADGCENTVAVTTTVKPKPTATITASDTEICEGITTYLKLTLTGTGPWTIVYTINDGASQTLVVPQDDENLVDNHDGTYTYTMSVTPSSNTTYKIISIQDANCFNDNPANQ